MISILRHSYVRHRPHAQSECSFYYIPAMQEWQEITSQGDYSKTSVPVLQSNLAHLAVVVLDDLQVEEVVLVLAAQNGVPTAGLGNLKLVLRAEIIR